MQPQRTARPPRRASVMLVCPVCRTPIRVFASRLIPGRQNYCSRLCSARWREGSPFSVAKQRPMVDPLVRLWSGITRGDISECWPWSGPLDSYGYGQFRVGGVKYRAHRLVWEATTGKSIPDGMVMRHSCHCRRCCNPHHLSIGTNADNTADMVAAGRQARGDKSHLAKFTSDDVRRIRSWRDEGASLSTIAAEFGVYKSTIRDIVRRKTWKHIE